jgi:hypothetical protein
MTRLAVLGKGAHERRSTMKPMATGKRILIASLLSLSLVSGAATTGLLAEPAPAYAERGPGARVDLFAERGGTWEWLDDQGQATADGQFVAFSHPGGSVAAGVDTIIESTAFPQQGITSIAQPAPAPAPRPALRVSLTGPTAARVSSTAEYTMVVSNVGTAAAQRVRASITGPRAQVLTAQKFTSLASVGGGLSCTAAFVEDANVPGIGQSSGSCDITTLAAGSSVELRLGVENPPQPVQTSLRAFAGNNLPPGPSTTSHSTTLQINICSATARLCLPPPPTTTNPG